MTLAASVTPILTETFVSSENANDANLGTVAILSNGTYLVAWHEDTTSSSVDVKAQLYGADGIAIGSPISLAQVTEGAQYGCSVAALTDGGFVATWTDQSLLLGDLSGRCVVAQRFDQFGNKVGNEFLVNEVTIGDQQQSKVIGLPNGGFAVCWEAWSSYLNARRDIFIKIYDANGELVVCPLKSDPP